MALFVVAILLFIASIIFKFVAGNTSAEKQAVKMYQERLSGGLSAYDKREAQVSIKNANIEIKKKRTVSTVGCAGGIVLAAILLAFSFVAIVPTGYTGIKTTFGKVENDSISAGINWILPWQNVVCMDNRTQKKEHKIQAFSSDIQQVDIAITINYSINQETAQILYKTVGVRYYDNIMEPRIEENTKAVFSQYTAEKLVEHRNELSAQVMAVTSTDLAQYGITVESISITDIDFTDAFTDAVEAKQVAAQRKLTAETEQAQKTMEERATAERAIIAENAKAQQAIIAANADLEVVQIQAEASLYAGQREAEMNQRIAEALTEDLLAYYWIKEWDGILPATMLSNDPSIMLTLGNTGK